ncbi:hypothetical protein [Aureimonas ureilytica]|uniref:hypothetical protein n=1 Tax=Aureimonas ureilytica TaxID=401562 RepID=UPI0007342DAD|nr:hypothetical protein [Aureimonas ureilytica]
MALRNALQTMKGHAFTASDPAVRWWVDTCWRQQRARSCAHGLTRPLVVSLTSYPPRFATLAYTLKSLLAQSVRADETVLWIAHRDHAGLPREVLDLQDDGLRIGLCEDVRSYKKYAWSFAEHPDAYVVTTDDDAYYWPSWLADLTSGLTVANERAIPSFRAHEITLDAHGAPLLYGAWRQNTSERRTAPTLFPTGLGGVVYVPSLLHPDVLDLDAARRLAPTADDMWLYVMARRAGLQFRKVGPKVRFRNWTGSQGSALYIENDASGSANDAQFAALTREFGRVWETA